MVSPFIWLIGSGKTHLALCAALSATSPIPYTGRRYAINMGIDHMKVNPRQSKKLFFYFGAKGFTYGVLPC